MKPVLTLAALLLATPAFAHSGDGHGSAMSGFLHPFGGADHLLAMVLVGLWAAQLGGRALWLTPTAFVAAMAAGFGLAISGVTLPLVEPAILASVIMLGVLVAMARPVAAPFAAALAGAFALFHGHAHGAELGSASALPYATGFVAATALLHLAGIGLGMGLARHAGSFVSRIGGGLAALAGLALAFA